MTGIFEECRNSEGGGNTDALLQCVVEKLESRQDLQASTLNGWLLVLSGGLVFFMQAGFAMLCAGSVRRKNAQNTMLKNLLDACGAAISFYCVGYAFAFGSESQERDTTFIGMENFFGRGDDLDLAVFFFQYAFSAASVTIVAGTLAERCQMAAYLSYSVVLTGFVYPVVAHAVWSSQGFLSAGNADPLLGIGMIDFAGSGVVHMTGGTTALFATYILGSRRGRFYDATTGRPLEIPKSFPGHSPSLQMLGTFILWFGWYGFNPGSALLLTDNPYQAEIAARCAVTTSASAAAGAISALFLNCYDMHKKTEEYHFDLTAAMNGSLSGLVAITAGCATLEPWAAIIMGLVGGFLYLRSSEFLITLRIDDAVDAIPVHMVNGIWGCIGTGLFSRPELLSKAYDNDVHPGFFYSLRGGNTDGSLLGCQLLGVIFVIGWTCFVMLPFFCWLNYMDWLRTESVQELVGLDISYHGGAQQAQTVLEEENIKEEYLDAYQRYKDTMKARRVGTQDAESVST